MTRKQELKADLNMIKMYQKQSTSADERLAYLKLARKLRWTLEELSGRGVR